MANIDFMDEDGDRIQFSEADDSSGEESAENDTPLATGGDGNLYGGAHYDYRGSVFHGPFIGKQVNR